MRSQSEEGFAIQSFPFYLSNLSTSSTLPVTPLSPSSLIGTLGHLPLLAAPRSSTTPRFPTFEIPLLSPLLRFIHTPQSQLLVLASQSDSYLIPLRSSSLLNTSSSTPSSPLNIFRPFLSISRLQQLLIFRRHSLSSCALFFVRFQSGFRNYGEPFTETRREIFGSDATPD